MSTQEAEISNKTNGRPIKFTPERIEQIRNLVERGTPREEIAEIINVTVGSLQVTCSRLGISLRRPKSIPSVAVSRGINPMMTEPPKTNGPPRLGLSLTMRLKDRERTYDLLITDEAMTRLALDAAMQGVSIGEIIARMIMEKYK